ncbi:MAG: universal stress protein [Planctomycetota bacterium]
MSRERPLILLTTDFSEEAGRAYGPVVDLAKRLSGHILLLHVVEAAPIAPHGAPLAPVQLTPDIASFVKAAKTHMANEVQKLGTVVHVEVAVVEGTDVATTVAQIARERNADYIAVSTHGRTGLRRLVLGSVAEAIVRHADVPVISFPAK